MTDRTILPTDIADGDRLDLTVERLPVYDTSDTSGRVFSVRVEASGAYVPNGVEGAIAHGSVYVRIRGTKSRAARFGRLSFYADGSTCEMVLEGATRGARYDVHAIAARKAAA